MSSKNIITSLISQFKDKYQTSNYSVIRAPGRVNLLGEHTDYNGYPVMPMAINREIFVCVSPSDDGNVTISNTNKRFIDRSFSLHSPIQPYPSGDWGNYVKAAIVGLLPHVLEKVEKPKGFFALYSGNIPLAAGLSSSSAMVVASALTFLHINNIDMPPLQLAEILAKAERFVGTEGGGMDQAITLMGQKGQALKIDFFPLQAIPISIPEDYEIIICNSLIRAPKTEEAMNSYNRRPIECRLTAALIANSLHKSCDISFEPKRLSDVDNKILEIPKTIYFKAIEEALIPPILTIDQLCKKLSLSNEALTEKYLTLKSGKIFTPPPDGFKIAQRYRHVLLETKHVETAVSALINGEALKFGELMNGSHRSCKEDYEISIPEIDKLVSLALLHGASGARITGAGFGGCTVNLVPKPKVDSFIDGIKKDYYHNYLKIEHPELVENINLENVIFSSKPVKGAEVLKL